MRVDAHVCPSPLPTCVRHSTHRFHLACKSDHILFLKGGKLLESGTHSELMQIENGEYKKM